MQGKITVLCADGETRVYERDTKPTLEFWQEQVGGYIERVPQFDTYEGEPCVVWCDEEGKLKGKPINDRATMLWANCLNIDLYAMQDVLVGDICIVQGDAAFMRAL